MHYMRQSNYCGVVARPRRSTGNMKNKRVSRKIKILFLGLLLSLITGNDSWAESLIFLIISDKILFFMAKLPLFTN